MLWCRIDMRKELRGRAGQDGGRGCRGPGARAALGEGCLGPLPWARRERLRGHRPTPGGATAGIAPGRELLRRRKHAATGNFRKPPQGEVRRTYLPRTPVNRNGREGEAA